jgi:hypothetical protein
MAYIINKSDGSILLTLQDGDLDVSTSLGLLGRNYTGYGEVQNENFIFLLENFANVNPPARPIKGQTWFDSANNVLKIYEGQQWIPVGSATLSDTPPAEVPGSFWLKTTTNQIYVFTASGWELVGPQGVEGFNKTRAESHILKDTNDVNHAVILFFVNGIVEAICSSTAFIINPSNIIPGFFNIVKGINISSFSVIQGTLSGNATTATRLETPRTINSVAFNGTENIVVKANTNNFLRKGDYLSGLDFDGSAERSWSVDASPENFVGKVVARDNAGSFSAQEISAVSFNGTLQGNVNSVSGTSFFNRIISPLIEGQNYTGNAASATRLNPGRFINGTYFDGTSNVTVTTNAQTLTGSFINSTVLDSNLRTVGNLLNLSVLDNGVEVGQGNKVRITATLAKPKISGDHSLEISNNTGSGINLVGPTEANTITGINSPAILPTTPDNISIINIGGPNRKFDQIFANKFVGNADSATRLENNRSINGIPFNGTQNIIIPASNVNKMLTRGLYLTGNNFDGTSATVWEVDASSVNLPNKIVVRDSLGNFSAQTISALTFNGNLLGNVTANSGTSVFNKIVSPIVEGQTFTGNAASATLASRLAVGRTINGVSFDGTGNIIIADNTKLPTVGGTITGNLTVSGKLTLPQAPTAGTDAVNKNYVDTLVASRPLFFSLDIRGLNLSGTGSGSVVSILNVLAPPSTLIAGTVCRVAGTIQNITANYFLSTTSRSMPQRITSVSLNGTTTVQNPTRNNNLVYQVNSARTSWQYVSG